MRIGGNLKGQSRLQAFLPRSARAIDLIVETCDGGGVPQTFKFVVQSEDAGLRLDQLMARRIPGLSRTAARRVLQEGGVFVGKRRVKVASRAVNPGEVVSASWTTSRQEEEQSDAAPELPVVFEDNDLIVIDKPSGVLSAPSQTSDRRSALTYLGRDLRRELYLVHRLDRGTSGLMAFAKTKEAARSLSLRFQDHDLERRYLALVQGVPSQTPFAVEEPIDGKSAHTTFTVRETYAGVSLIEAELSTGRTHQVRRHALFVGHPVLGDRLYRLPGPIFQPMAPRLMLHAFVLCLGHPRTDETLRFESPAPQAFRSYIERLPPQII